MDPVYRVTAVVRVSDKRALIDYADKRTYVCWQDSLSNMAGAKTPLVEQALLEAIIISNENPSPDEYGIEFLNFEVERLDG